MSDALYSVIFNVAAALETPVIIVTLLAGAVAVIELGRVVAELLQRRHRDVPRLASAVAERVAAGTVEPPPGAGLAPRARDSLRRIQRAATSGEPTAEARMSKELADLDLDAERCLGRSRLLVRAGPALGLMGTLIPLSPALDGLARGNITALTENLRVAFSVTVLGILIGLIGFAITVVRDRLYSQDHSDLEYVAAVLTTPGRS